MKKAMIRFANRVDLILLLFGVHCSVRSSTPHHADDYLCPNLLPQILFFIFDEYETIVMAFYPISRLDACRSRNFPSPALVFQQIFEKW